MKLPIELEFKSTAILAGAGISIASGIASGQMFNSILLPRLIPAEIAHDDRRSNPLLNPAPARRRPARGNIRFEQLIDIIRRFADPDLLLIQYLELSWEPTTFHHWLAKAIANDSIVLTTNLDSLIELAYLQEKNHCPRQIIDTQDWNTYNEHASSIFKLHGTIRRQNFLTQFNWHTKPDPLANRENRAIETFCVTLDRIGNLVSSRDSTAAQFLLPDYILATLQQVLANRDLVIIGYSGSDDFDVMPSLWHLGKFYRRLIWIKHETPGTPVIRSHRKLTLIRGSTLEILESLFGEPLPISTSNINAHHALESLCDRWCQEIHLNEQKRFLITGSVLNAMGLISKSLSVWESGLDNLTSNDPATAARFCLLLGEGYLTERSWYHATEVFEVAMLRSQRTSDVVLNAQSQLRYAFILAISSQISEDPHRIWKQSCSLLGQLFGMSAFGPELIEYEVRTAMTIATLARFSGSQEIVSQCSVYNDRLSLMQHYENWPILQDNKILRAEFLAEIALAEFENDQTLLFEKHKKEFVSLCISLHTPLLHATFMLELADLAGKKDNKGTSGLYQESEALFRRSGYPVGVAEAILGKQIMAWATGDAIETHDLQEARDTFEEENLSWNLELIDYFLSNRENTKEHNTIIDNFYENIHKHWREFLGKAGWLTSLSASPDLEK